MQTINKEYNYVIYSINQDYFEVLFYDILDENNVEYMPHVLSHYENSNLIKRLHDIHYHPTLNKYVQLPFKSLWNKYYFRNNFRDQSKPICFIFLMSYIRPEYVPFFKYLKAEYPSCKLVTYFEDIVASRSYLDLSIIKDYFDLAISYEESEAKQLGFLYYPTFYSAISLKDLDSKKSDLFFCGAAKNRYDDITSVFEELNLHGLDLDFYVARMLSGQEKRDGIHYIDYVIPYQEYLIHVANTNCILDIVQQNCIGFTIRTWEALAFGKKMLTNNPSILKAPFANSDQFQYYNHPSEINTEWLKSSLTNPNKDYLPTLSPVNFINYIANHL